MQMPSSSNQSRAQITLPYISIQGGQSPTKAVAKPQPEATLAPEPPKFIMVGLDDQAKPHASWFAEEDGDAAAVAADLMNMALIDITSEELASIAAKLPRGKLFESGKAFVPFVKRTVYEQLAKYLDDDYLTTAAARVEAVQAASAEGYAKVSKGEIPPRQPEDWSKLAVGDLVLATDDPEDGWYEALVLEAAGDDRFRLRWRGWPELPTFTRAFAEIALLHPNYVAA